MTCETGNGQSLCPRRIWLTVSGLSDAPTAYAMLRDAILSDGSCDSPEQQDSI